MLSTPVKDPDSSLLEVFSTPIGELQQSRRKMAEEFDILVKQRGAVKGKITRIKNVLGQHTQNQTIPDEFLLHTQLKTIDAAYEEFNHFQNKIYAAKPAEADDQEKKYVEFEADYNFVRAKVCQLLRGVKQEPDPQPPAAAQPVRVQATSSLHTPLPSFDGKPENWYKFKAIFTDVMSKHPGESDATKLYHLDKCLVGEAVGSIDQQTINDSDFAAAWAELTEQYENKRRIVDIHVGGLLNLKPMTSESGKQLRELVDGCKRHVSALNFHEFPMAGLADILVVNILASKLDIETRKVWETSIEHGEIPNYADTVKFLTTRSQVLERIELADNKQKKPVAAKTTKIPALKASSLAASVEYRCAFCGQEHQNHECGEYLKLDPKERYEKAKQTGVCFNCLKKGHITRRCSSTKTCKACKKRHHSTLHLNETGVAVEQPLARSTQNSTTATPSAGPAGTTAVTASCVIYQQRALLCTAIVNILDDGGKALPCRVLLDCGSQVNLCTEKVASLLRLKRRSVNVDVKGVDGSTTRVTALVHINVQSRDNVYTSNLECLVINRITGTIPAKNIDISTWPVPAGLQLADPEFYRPQRVDMLIGVGQFFGLLKTGKVKLAESLPFLQETVFGWVVGGLADSTSWKYEVTRCNVAVQDAELNDLVERFWESEAVPTASRMSSEETACEQCYEQTHSRDPSGRYVVMLPFRGNVSQLGDSKQHALQRFSYLEKKLAKNADLKAAYCAFMEEYVRLGHCREIDPSKEEDGGYYLPHHAILKPSSSTTKLRTVFDASAQTSSGLSLNDTLMVGPTIQDPLFDIALRFRTYPYVFTADISKMYRMVRVHPDHTKFQRVFWRTDPSESLKTLELLTVTYGTASAPYLATRTLKQLAQDEGQAYPRAAKILENDFYIDDALAGADTLKELLLARDELEELLEKGGFELHKWCSNSAEFLDTIPDERREKQVSFELSGVNEMIKTLGILWNPTSDKLLFRVALTDLTQPVSKRRILSEVARSFDPLGLQAPVCVTAKLILRQCWRKKVSWDEQLCKVLTELWNKFRGGLRALMEVQIERRVIVPHRVALELHAFSDASLEAYGTCVYVRNILADNTAVAYLLCSKSHLAPKETIPKLELCGFRLMSRLVSRVMKALKVKFTRKVLYSDSTIVLGWLAKSPSELETYVANRVAEIHELTPRADYEYKYVRSSANPADLVSRGLFPEALIGNRFWFHGGFLEENDYQEDEMAIVVELPEVRVAAVVITDEQEEDYNRIFTRFSSFRKLQRVLAYVIRFCNKTRKRSTYGDNDKYPTIPELRSSLRSIVYMVQQQRMQTDIQEVLKKQGKPNERYTGRLRSLNPWVDTYGILRVNGRIKYANVSYEQRCPAILPAEHPVTAILVQAVHEENLHVGPSGTLSVLRQRYWILNGRNAIRARLRKCVRCFKVNPSETKLFMGDLPSYRVTQAYPFERVGVDFAGPIYVRKGHPRKPVYCKAYVALFVCMVTKCIHIELVSNLTTDAFIAALHRFVARRGLPSDVYSDNATNFAGASSELHELYALLTQQLTKDALQEFCLPKEIRWHFIPPRSPHVGGLWEAGVKSAKHLIKRNAGETKLTEEEWSTLLTQIEGILNSRPLVPQTADPGDLNVITPGHLLIGRPFNAIPEPAYDQLKPGTLTRWQHLQKMRADFWKRWSAGYLSELQQRQKWNKQHTVVMEGDLVLLKEENVPALQWRLGRVVKVHPGQDGVTRVVTVKTAGGVYKRSTAKVAVLPLDDEAEEKTAG